MGKAQTNFVSLRSVMKVNKSLCQVLSTVVYQSHLVFMYTFYRHEFSDIASKKSLKLSSKTTVTFKLTKYGNSNPF